MDIIGQIKEFVKQECKKSNSKYGYEPFFFHFAPVVKYADKLADELGGDKEVIILAAWLHDIGSIVYGRKNHHITGARIARGKLKSLKYPARKTALVEKCILNHRSSKNLQRKTIEEKIIAEADTLNAFNSIAGLFKAAFIYENKTQEETKISVRKKLQKKWGQLHFEKSKRILYPKYRAAMLLLK